MSRITICAKCPSAGLGKWQEAIDNGTGFKEIKIGTLCKECKCPIHAKSRSPLEQCPLGKWGETQKRNNTMKANSYVLFLDEITEAMCKIYQTSDKSELSNFHLPAEAKYFIEQTTESVIRNIGLLKNELYFHETGIVQPDMKENVYRRYSGRISILKSDTARQQEAFKFMTQLNDFCGKILSAINEKEIHFSNKGILPKTGMITVKEESVFKGLEELLKFFQREAVSDMPSHEIVTNHKEEKP